VVVGNRALEEFSERLLRWDELCTQLRELYHRYLDLAAFRSEKCYFPGRKCKRPWGREYDLGDITLMWTYILNTAPLCGKLMRALAEVEYEIRRKALESLEKYGGIILQSKDGTLKIRLKEQIVAYLVVQDKWLYVIWGEFDDLPKNGQLRAIEIESRVVNLVKRYERGIVEGMDVDKYQVDGEYKRFWLEVPLPPTVSRVLGGRDRAPIALFRNLGWLLSDDYRNDLQHAAANFGQVALRIFDWIALARYAIDVLRIAMDKPLVFKLSVSYIVETSKNPIVVVHPIGISELIKDTYKLFGMNLGKTERVIARGYVVLKALKDGAFKKDGKTYVVDDVKAWIGFSNVVATLIIGDGSIVFPYYIKIAVKSAPEETLNGTTSLAKMLADSVGGSAHDNRVHLYGWHLRLMLPAQSVPVFDKTERLYRILTEYPVAVTIKMSGDVYILYVMGFGRFAISGNKAKMLYQMIRHIEPNVKFDGETLFITYKQLESLKNRGVEVRLLNEAEKDRIREVKPALTPDLEALKKVLEEIAKMAKITVESVGGRTYIKIKRYNASEIRKMATMLRGVGLRISASPKSGEIRIYHQKSIEIIRKVLPHIFSQSSEAKKVVLIQSDKSDCIHA